VADAEKELELYHKLQAAQGNSAQPSESGNP
jgi:hypothetical protein